MPFISKAYPSTSRRCPLYRAMLNFCLVMFMIYLSFGCGLVGWLRIRSAVRLPAIAPAIAPAMAKAAAAVIRAAFMRSPPLLVF